MFINRLLDGSGGVVPHTLTLCKDILTRHYEICDGVYGMMLDTLVGSKYCKKSVKLSDTIRISFCWVSVLWFPGGSVVKNPSASAVDTGDTGSILGLGKAPGEERATCSYILGWEIPWTGAWWTVAHGVKKSQTRLSDWASKLWQSEKAEPGRLEDSPVPEEEGLFNREVPECPPRLSPEAGPCRASVWMKRRPPPLPSGLCDGRPVNQETWKGCRRRFTIISSGSISERHRQGTSSLNEFLLTAIFLRSIQMAVDMYFYFMKILSDSSYWEIIWLLPRPPFSSRDMQKVSGDTEVWLWKLWIWPIRDYLLSTWAK